MADKPEQPPSAGKGRGAMLRAALERKRAAETVSETKPPAPVNVLDSLKLARDLTAIRDSSSSSTKTVSLGRGIKPIKSDQVGELSSKLSTVTVQDSVVSHKEQSVVSSVGETEPVIKIGTSGRTVPGTANYIKLQLEPGKGVFEYEVRFDPHVDAKGIKINLLNQHMRNCVKTFDGVILYLPDQFPDPITRYTSIHPVDNSNIEVSIIFKKKKRLGECIHLYNVLFKKIMFSLKYAMIGREHFNPSTPKIIPQHKLEIWPGYVTAVDEYEGGIMLCIDSSHRVLRTETVHDFLKGLLHSNPKNFKDETMKTLIGSSVLTRYNNKLYVIDDIDWNSTPLNTFMAHNGDEITYLDYYKKNYAVNIKDIRQPLLINKVKRRVPNSKEKEESLVCLIPELCYMTGLTDAMRTDFRVMKDIAMYTRITPNQRMAALRQYCRNVQENADAQRMLNAWGLKIANATIDLSIRILEPEKIIFGGGEKVHGTPEADWGMAVTKKRVISAIDLITWLLVYTQRDRSAADLFAEQIEKIGPPMGITVNRPQMHCLRDDSTATYATVLNSLIHPNLQIIVIIVPTQREDRYSCIKRICCVEKPVASQVIKSRTLGNPKRVRSIIQKIVLQMNCKLGGQLWGVHIPMKGLMVCGIDTYHESRTCGHSVGAFIASINPAITRWYSQVGFQTKGVELMDSLKVCFMSALKKYYDVNGCWPQNIVIYRDGVGDGQLRYCKEHEVTQLEECLKHHVGHKGNIPGLSFVVVQKRINTRMFTYNDRDLVNPPPGSIVDYSITRRNLYDFFLVSQHVTQGTVTPTHYVVVHDGCQLPVDHMQRLTYKMTHLYYNWPGTVRVPAPCQYAHKLAYLVGQSVRKNPSDKLADRLYFL